MTTLSSIRNAAIEDAGAGGLTVYATKEDLPTSGLTAGDQAYVSASSRLYVSNGSGWYNIALINATPSLSIDPTGTIVLSTTGETTTITLTGTDSDNAVDGLTFSVESDGSFGGLATISQDSSVFTITPLSEDSATTASAVLTFKASDGINFGSGDRTLTLSFKVENSNYTTLLLKNEETTDNQVDASTNNHTITENGDVTSTAFSPYHPGGYSTYFDGTGDYLTIPNGSALEFGTSDYTIELWYNVSNINTQQTILDGRSAGSNGAYPLITHLNNVIQYYVNGSFEIVGTTTIVANTWYHVAISRSSGSTKLFLNGTQEGSTWSDNTNYSAASSTVYVGSNHGSTTPLNGYIENLRILKGVAEYTANFTPPTAPLTAIANTSLLTCHAPYIADGSSNNHTVTVVGNTSTKRFGPFDYLGYAKADHGGSVYFDGSGDYLQLPSDAGFSFGTGDFTVEVWVYYPAISNTNGKAVIDSRPTSTNGSYWLLGPGNSGVMSFTTMTTGGNSVQDTVARPNQWVHYAATRSGTSLRLFANGELVASTTDSSNISSGSPTIGKNAYGETAPDTWWLGYISDVRIVKGTAVYTAAFTPPTAPLTAITNTQLLTCTNKNDIWDTGSGNRLTKAGDVTGGGNSGTLKFGKTAVYFDGNGDNITISDLAMGSGDCTFEFWMYQNIAQSAAYRCMLAASTYGSGIPFTIYTYSSNVQVWLSSGGSAEISGAFTASTWHHIALVRNSGTWTLYIDGTSAGTSTTGGSYNFAATTDWRFGENHSGSYDWQGYIQDPRFTIGLARYTGNFTPPTAEFNG